MAGPPTALRLAAWEVVLGQPEQGFLSQRDLHSLRCVDKSANATARALCFQHRGRAGHWFLDHEGKVQPVGAPPHHWLLEPLLLDGVVPFRYAVKGAPPPRGRAGGAEPPKMSPLERRSMGAELEARWNALASCGRVAAREWHILGTFARARSKSKLWFTLSCGVVWAVSLGLLSMRAVLRSEQNESLCALLGTNEMPAFSKHSVNSSRPRGCSRRCRSRVCRQATHAHPRGGDLRPLRTQWEICRWLWRELANPRVRALLKRCITPKALVRPGSQQLLAPSLVRLCVETRVARQALSEGVVDLDECVRLYDMCGLGHVKQALSREGVAAIRKGAVTVAQMMRLPKHKIVRALVRHPDVIAFNDVTAMSAPLEDRSRMIEVVVRTRERWAGKHESAELLSLASFDTLEFVLSTSGAAALRRLGIPLSELRGRGRRQPFELGARFRRPDAQVLRTFVQSPAAQELLAEGLASVPRVLQNVANVEVLSVLLSRAGMRALRSGRLRVEDVNHVTRATKVLAMLSEPSPQAAQDQSQKDTGTGSQEADCIGGEAGHGAERETERGEPSANVDQAKVRAHAASVRAFMAQRSCARAEAVAALAADGWDLRAALASTAALHGGRQSARRDCEAAEHEMRGHDDADPDPAETHGADCEREAWDSRAAFVAHECRQAQTQRCLEEFLDSAQVACSREEAGGLLRRCRWNVGAALNLLHEQAKRDRAKARMEHVSLPQKRKLHMVALRRLGGGGPRRRAPRTCLLDDEGCEGDRQSEGSDSEPPGSPSEPTEAQLNTLLRFMEVTGSKTEEGSVNMLRMCNWDLETAVQTHLAQLQG